MSVTSHTPIHHMPYKSHHVNTLIETHTIHFMPWKISLGNKKSQCVNEPLIKVIFVYTLWLTHCTFHWCLHPSPQVPWFGVFWTVLPLLNNGYNDDKRIAWRVFNGSHCYMARSVLDLIFRDSSCIDLLSELSRAPSNGLILSKAETHILKYLGLSISTTYNGLVIRLTT